MATSAQTSAHVAKSRASSAAGKYFYFFMSLLVAAVVIYGFSHTVGSKPGPCDSGAAMAAMTVVGFTTAIVMRRFDMRFEPPEIAQPAGFLIVPFWDITCFTVLFWLAVSWRRKPEMHRRLMLIATCVLTAAAWGRMPNQTLSGSTRVWTP